MNGRGELNGADKCEPLLNSKIYFDCLDQVTQIDLYVYKNVQNLYAACYINWNFNTDLKKSLSFRQVNHQFWFE
jgi:hypothetical protein